MTARLVCLLLLLVSCGSGGRRRAPDGAPSLILISIDTLRADRLGCYGHGRDTSPALDRFAGQGFRFENAIAESPWTLPSHATMLTGLHPLRHGARTPKVRPSHEVPLLAERLRDAGWSTFALTSGGWLTETWGFGRGFELFEIDRRPFAAVLERARELLLERRAAGPVFAFLHTYDVHCPYDPPEPWFSRFRDPASQPFESRGQCGNPDLNARKRSRGEDSYLSDLYDGGVAWVDAALEPFLAFLEEEGWLGDTLVVVTSDHGEELGEHGLIGHERTLSSEALRIPLILRGAGVRPGTSAEIVGLRDLVPTALEVLGLPPDPELDGRSLAPLVREDAGATLPGATAGVSDLGWQSRLLSRIDADSQVLVDEETGRSLFYWRGERVRTADLEGQLAARFREGREALQRAERSLLADRRPPEPAGNGSEAELESLQALGYGGGD